jgi:hypothetical protein
LRLKLNDDEKIDYRTMLMVQYTKLRVNKHKRPLHIENLKQRASIAEFNFSATIVHHPVYQLARSAVTKIRNNRRFDLRILVKKARQFKWCGKPV